MKGDLYQGQEQALKRKKVKADTVETEKEYQDGSVKLSAIEQFILDLIKPYSKRKAVFLSGKFKWAYVKKFRQILLKHLMMI